MEDQILVVYWEIPDKARFYLIPKAEVNFQQFEILNNLQGLVINSVELTEAQQKFFNSFHDFVCENPAWFLIPKNPFGSLWAKYRVDESKIIIGNIKEVYSFSYKNPEDQNPKDPIDKDLKDQNAC